MGSPDGLPEQLPAPRPGGHPHPRRATTSPLHVHDPHVQSALHPLHTNYHAPTDHWVVHGTDSLLPADYAPPPHSPGPDTYASGDDPDDPRIWGTWERKSLDTRLSIRSSSQGLGRAMYCLAKWTQRTWGIPTDRWVWVVTLRPQQREAPPNRRGPTPPRPTTLCNGTQHVKIELSMSVLVSLPSKCSFL